MRSPRIVTTLGLASLLALGSATVVGCESSENSEESEPRESTSSTDNAPSDEHSARVKHHRGKKESPSHAHESGTGADKHGHDHGSTEKKAEGHGRHHDFDNPEKYAKDWNSEKRDDWQKPKQVLEILGAESGERVVDLGTGTGYFLPHLSQAVGPEGGVLALDVSEKMLEYVRSEIQPDLPHDNVVLRRVERDDPGLEAQSVDHVLMVNTWHHVKDRVGYGKKLLEALRPGGSFVDVDYTLQSDRGPPKKIRLKPEEATEELREAGFEVEIAEESLPKQYVVVATKPE